jgi:hypothetical protein
MSNSRSLPSSPLRRAAGALLLSSLAAGATAGAALAADAPVEGYRSPDGRIACVLLQGYDASGNAVACGSRSSSRGVLLTGSGAARATPWNWPATQLGSAFFTARWGRTLFLSGGTAKLTGASTTLHCTFTRPTAVLCLNRSGHGLVVTPARASAVAPLTA